MNTFEITIQRPAGAAYPVVVEESASGAFLRVRTEGTLQLDPVTLLPHLLDACTYGTLLGQALFRDRVRDVFARACRESADLLCVLLNIEASASKCYVGSACVLPSTPRGTCSRSISASYFRSISPACLARTVKTAARALAKGG